ncbi:hypothetical protein TKK_0010526 [Trichogramma kaykai]|uniref:Uncharacterized protein n=1 Tax=Trichogramma kaykai TaxID=54128 RepID=A0ABD2WV88_9HYME
MGQRNEQRPSPWLTAGLFNRLVFGWLGKIIERSQQKRRDLARADLYAALPSDHSELLAGRLERHWREELEEARARQRKPRLLRPVCRVFGWSYALYALPMLLLNCLRILQPVALGWLIRYFERGSETTANQAYGYAAVLISATLLHSFLKHHIDLGTLRLGMRLRIACSALVHRKTLRLATTAVNSGTSGRMVNLLSNDVARFDQLFMYLHYVWLTPLATCCIGYLVWDKVQISALAGVLTMALVTVPLQVCAGMITTRYRKRIAARTDERVRLMAELIHGIQVIKMYAWERPFEYIVSRARSYEIDVISYMSYLRGAIISSNAFVDRTCLFLTIATYALIGGSITADKVFTMVAYFTILQNLWAYNFPRAVANAVEARVSVKRIEKFLIVKEIKIKAPTLSAEENASISINSMTVSWTKKRIANTVHNVTMYITPKQLHAIIGPTSSGKTTLIYSMLGELRESLGGLVIRGTIAYASQKPWLFPGTIRQNIVFDQRYDEARYQSVIRCCALEHDLETMPLRDETLVEDKGTNLSGGQRTRINLARAVYRQADIYVFDDPLSSVDATVAQHIINDCINGFLKDNTRIIVTFNMQCLRQADTIFLIKNGTLEMQGKLSSLSEKELELLKLSSGDREKTDNSKVIENINNQKNTYLNNKSDHITLKPSKNYDKGDPQETEELIAKGKMKSSIFLRYFRTGNSDFLLGLTFLFFFIAQIVRCGSDYWLAYWTKNEEIRMSYLAQQAMKNQTNNTTTNTVTSQITGTVIEAVKNRTVRNIIDPVENQTASTIMDVIRDQTTTAIIDAVKNQTTSTVASTIDAVNTESSFTLSANVTEAPTLNVTESTTLIQDLLSTTVTSINNNSSYLNQSMINSTQEEPKYMEMDLSLMIYGSILFFCILTTISKILLLYTVCMNSSRKIHNEMFSCVLKAPLSFFNKQSSGRILNRFSKDTGSMDETLPLTLHESIEVFSIILGVLFQVFIVKWWSILPLIAAAIVYLKIRNLYVPIAYGIKRLEGAAKSPVFSHAISSLEGMVTIRSNRAQTFISKQFDTLQNEHTSAHYLHIVVSSAFGLWLDLVSCGVVASVILFLLISGPNTFAGEVGLIITQVLMLCGMLQRGIRQSAETATQMTSVERILQFTDLEQEESDEKALTAVKPNNWPSEGKIEFKNYNLRYADDADFALRDVNFTIEAGSKIGIVGRTGAGKSSLISALFRLAQGEGQVLIDDIDISSVPLYELRKRITVIPQETVLFSASYRDNLDPFHEFNDVQLWTALEGAKCNKGEPLDHPIECSGSGLSAGERQLLCLARAILKHTRIIILDEATASVDPEKDALVRNTIRSKYSDCTVITVSHKLDSVLDNDRVLVIDDGRVIEYDHPHVLLQNENSLFTKLAKQMGETKYEKLKKDAQEMYKLINKTETMTENTHAVETQYNGGVKNVDNKKSVDNSDSEFTDAVDVQSNKSAMSLGSVKETENSDIEMNDSVEVQSNVSAKSASSNKEIDNSDSEFIDAVNVKSNGSIKNANSNEKVHHSGTEK